MPDLPLNIYASCVDCFIMIITKRSMRIKFSFCGRILSVSVVNTRGRQTLSTGSHHGLGLNNTAGLCSYKMLLSFVEVFFKC